MEVVIHLVLVYCPQHRFEVFIQNMVRASQLQIMNAELVWRQSEILKDIDAHCKKIWKDADWDEAPTCSPQSKSFLICPSTLCSMMMKEGATW